MNMANNVSSEAGVREAGARAFVRAIGCVIAAALAAAPAAGSDAPSDAATGWPPVIGAGEAMLADPRSGFALGGFDPVTFFLGAVPRAGSADFELIWNGVAWRFVSEANREAFRRDPGVYAPRLGGHDAQGIGEGRLSPADPVLFVVRDARLYLFRSEASRRAFEADAAAHLRAEARWKDLARAFDRGDEPGRR
jgi:YHS domain-containing protein